jgi:hypothetical protein
MDQVSAQLGNFSHGFVHPSVSQSKTTILIAKVQTWQKCKIVIMSLKDEKGEIMVRERLPKHNLPTQPLSNLFLTPYPLTSSKNHAP